MHSGRNLFGDSSRLRILSGGVPAGIIFVPDGALSQKEAELKEFLQIRNDVVVGEVRQIAVLMR